MTMMTLNTSLPSAKDKSDFLELALEEASLAQDHDDVPVGAVLVKAGKVLARAHNQREKDQNPCAHAEVQALILASEKEKSWNLSGTTLYVSLEPCPMCAGALVMARVDKVIYAAKDPKGGAISLNIPILNNAKLNHRLEEEFFPGEGGQLEIKSAALLKSFFQKKRKEKNISGTKA